MDDADPRPQRLYGVVLDCADVGELVDFWQQLLGWDVVTREDDWASLVDPADRTKRLSMQRTAGHRAATWPAHDVPQQVHLDLAVDDLATADARAQRLGAVPAGDVVVDEWETLRVFRDPAGHPFCLIQQFAPPPG